jgi:leucyl/phenylalanyl-tRNA--protein transferase
MFTLLPNASKAAFLALAQILFSDEVRFIDCQVPTDHLRSLGAQEISRREFLARLYSALAIRNSSIRMESIIAGPNANAHAASDEADRRGNWGHRYVRFPETGSLQGTPLSSP